MMKPITLLAMLAVALIFSGTMAVAQAPANDAVQLDNVNDTVVDSSNEPIVPCVADAQEIAVSASDSAVPCPSEIIPIAPTPPVVCGNDAADVADSSDATDCQDERNDSATVIGGVITSPEVEVTPAPAPAIPPAAPVVSPPESPPLLGVIFHPIYPPKTPKATTALSAEPVVESNDGPRTTTGSDPRIDPAAVALAALPSATTAHAVPAAVAPANSPLTGLVSSATNPLIGLGVLVVLGGLYLRFRK